jgi:DNA polymerase-3 subunit delta
VNFTYAKGSNIDYDATFEQNAAMFGKNTYRDSRSKEEMLKEAVDVASKADVILLAIGETAEIRKLEMYLGDRKNVEVEDVEACVSRRREENIFDFTKSLGEAKKAQSLSHLNSLLQQGQNELGILSMVARHLRLLILLKQGQAEGLQGVKLAQYAQVPPYFISNYLQQAKLWSVQALEKSLVLLADADRNLKAPVLPTHFYLETLVLKICALASL